MVSLAVHLVNLGSARRYFRVWMLLTNVSRSPLSTILSIMRSRHCPSKLEITYKSLDPNSSRTICYATTIKIAVLSVI
jgi:hypothetical protein